MENIIEQISIHEDSTIREAMKAISLGAFGAALSVEKESKFFNRIITDGDIRRALLNGYGLQSAIKTIDKQAVVFVPKDTPYSEVTALFSERIKIIPVVNSQNQVVDLHFHDQRNHIAVASPFFDDEEIKLVNECMVSGWISSSGKFVTQFEKMVAEHTGVNYAITSSSGTSALHLILMAYGIGLGDEVIVPSMSFIATANAVSYTGAKPIFVDSDLESWNIDPYQIESMITEKTKAIIVVHLYGHPADMDLIKNIAKKYNLKVIEDAAEAQGAKYKGKNVGTLADAAMFSFFGNKIITTGEGGMVLTNDSKIADKCRLMRDHGMMPKSRYWHELIGYNYRMTNIQAAIGVAQMGKIESIIEKKKIIALEYDNRLSKIKEIILPPNAEWADNIYWLYTILIDDILDFSVEDLTKVLKENNIDSRIVFYPIHTQPIYLTGQSLPVSESLHKKGISLPSSPNISLKDISKVCEIISKMVNNSCEV